MVMLVKLLGILIVSAVIFLATKPGVIKSYMDFWTKQKRIYYGAVVSVVLGVILLRASGLCRVGWIVVLLGILSIAKGVWLCYIGPEKLKAQCDWIVKLPPKKLRLLMLISLGFGILLIYAA